MSADSLDKKIKTKIERDYHEKPDNPSDASKDVGSNVPLLERINGLLDKPNLKPEYRKALEDSIAGQQANSLDQPNETSNQPTDGISQPSDMPTDQMTDSISQSSDLPSFRGNPNPDSSLREIDGKMEPGNTIGADQMAARTQGINDILEYQDTVFPSTFGERSTATDAFEPVHQSGADSQPNSIRQTDNLGDFTPELREAQAAKDNLNGSYGQNQDTEAEQAAESTLDTPEVEDTSAASGESADLASRYETPQSDSPPVETSAPTESSQF